MNVRLALIVLAIWPLTVLAAASHVALPGGDELWLAIPEAWNQRFEAPDKKTPRSVWFSQRQGSTFNILITPLTGTPMAAALADQNKLRAVVTAISRDALAQSVEMSLPVHELPGNNVRGFLLLRHGSRSKTARMEIFEASAALYSIVSTARANGLEPYAYLKQLFTELPKAQTVEDFEALLPFNIIT